MIGSAGAARTSRAGVFAVLAAVTLSLTACGAPSDDDLRGALTSSSQLNVDDDVAPFGPGFAKPVEEDASYATFLHQGRVAGIYTFDDDLTRDAHAYRSFSNGDGAEGEATLASYDDGGDLGDAFEGLIEELQACTEDSVGFDDNTWEFTVKTFEMNVPNADAAFRLHMDGSLIGNAGKTVPYYVTMEAMLDGHLVSSVLIRSLDDPLLNEELHDIAVQQFEDARES